MADPIRVRIRLGWHLAVKCVATLAPRLRRHHASRVSPLAPRVAEAHLLAEDLLLADGHLLTHLVAHAPIQMLRCDKIYLPRSLPGSTLHPPVLCRVVFPLEARHKTMCLLLLLHRRLLLDPTVPPRDANARLREVARARGSQGGASGLQSSAS